MWFLWVILCEVELASDLIWQEKTEVDEKQKDLYKQIETSFDCSMDFVCVLCHENHKKKMKSNEMKQI